MPGPVSAELFTRWIQWGAFSPILRTHTTKNPAAERRIWAYAPEYFRAMRDAVRFRSSLLPYIYTSARTAYDTGISLCRPMYLQWPERPEAYAVPGLYMFGEDMLVAPVTDSITAADRRSGRRIWIPPGSWYEWCSGTTLTGPAILERRFALEEIPVYVRSGAIIPMQKSGMRAGEDAGGELVLSIVPGDSGRALVYEDGGNSTAYGNDACRWTAVGYGREGGRTTIRIEPVKGGFPGAHEERSYVIRLEGEWPPEEVRCNGRILGRGGKDGEGGWDYDGDRAAVVITTPVMNVHGVATVDVSIADDAGGRRTMLNGLPGSIARVARVIPWLEAAWPREWAPDEFVAASQTGLGLSADPSRAEEWIARFHERVLAGAAKVRAMAIDQSVKDAVLGHLHDDTGGR